MIGLINTAWADTMMGGAPGGASNNSFASMLVIIGFVVVFYFLLWRPQAKRAKEHKELINSLNKGDEIVTSGGIIGRIVKISDDFLVLAVSDTLEVKLQRDAISKVLPKGTMKSI